MNDLAKKRIIAVSVTCAFVLFCIHGCDGCGDPPQPPTASQLLDSKYLSDRYEIEARSRCEVGADDYLRSIAKYDFAWDSKEPEFLEFYKEIAEPGVMRWVTRKAKLQNGFGSYKHIVLTCDYDTQSGKVIEYGQN